MKKTFYPFVLLLALLTSVPLAAQSTTAAAPSSSWDVLGVILLAAILGLVGQGVRLLLGWAKLNQRNDANQQQFNERMQNNESLRASGLSFEAEIFSSKRMGVTLGIAALVGIVAGVVAYLSMKSVDITDKTVLLSFVGAGYVGMDFIEAGIQKWLPKA